MTTPILQVIIASVRPGRIGSSIADWFIPLAEAQGSFTVERVDLKEMALPLMDEPHHPRLRKYEHEHTKRWSATIDRADAFVFVTPEYDFSPPASLINAIQFLAQEWAYKPVGLLSYGGISAGLRSANQLRIIASANSMMPLSEAVSIPLAGQLVNKETGQFVPGETQDKAATNLVKQLGRWSAALKTLRA